MGVALAALQLVALGGETALELCDDLVDLREILDGARGKGAVELVERTLRREARCALDQIAFECWRTDQLEDFVKVLSRDRNAAGIV